jgi:TldD protein
MVTRRGFLEASSAAAFAASLYATPADVSKPNPELEKLGAVALAAAKGLKATYCDIRIVRYRVQTIGLRMTPERGTGKTLSVPFVSDTRSFGFGVRLIADGAWGFAASPIVTPGDVARITREAVGVARANAALNINPVQLTCRAGVRSPRA